MILYLNVATEVSLDCRFLHLREAILATPLPRSYERWRKPLRMLMQMKSPLPELWPPL